MKHWPFTIPQHKHTSYYLTSTHSSRDYYTFTVEIWNGNGMPCTGRTIASYLRSVTAHREREHDEKETEGRGTRTYKYPVVLDIYISWNRRDVLVRCVRGQLGSGVEGEGREERGGGRGEGREGKGDREGGRGTSEKMRERCKPFRYLFFLVVLESFLGLFVDSHGQLLLMLHPLIF